MSNCWRCGRELPDGQVECEEDCPGERENAHRALARLFQQDQRNFYRRTVTIDWDKVTCFADLKEIFRVFYCEVRFMPGTPAYEQLKRFLNNPPSSDSGAAREGGQ